KRVIAAAVEPSGRDAFEVADTRQRDRHQPVEELPHPLPAQRHHRRDRHAFADLERRDRLLRAACHRLLACDARQLIGPDVDQLRVRRRLAQTHVDDDLVDPRDGHDVLVAEFLRERRHHFLLVLLFQARHLSTTPSHLRHTRTLRPSPRILWPMRVCAPHSGHTNWALEACSDASRSTIPPLMFLPGFGLVWRLIMFTPSTIRRFLSGSTFSTRPRLPRSLPVMIS